MRKINVFPRNKRGWVKIIEAFVAILLITGVVLLFLNKRYIGGEDNSENIYKAENAILDRILIEDSLRNIVLTHTVPSEGNDISLTIRQKINTETPSYLNCSAKICYIDNDCLSSLVIDKSVYVKSAIFSSNSASYSPRQLKLFCWEK